MGELPTETCENCGRVIGKLETPRAFDGHVVCAECHARLAKSPATRELNWDRELASESERTLRRMEGSQRFWVRVLLYGAAVAVIIYILNTARQHNIDRILNP